MVNDGKTSKSVNSSKAAIYVSVQLSMLQIYVIHPKLVIILGDVIS